MSEQQCIFLLMGNGAAKLRNPRGISNGCTRSVQSGETTVVSMVAEVVCRLLNRLLHNSVEIKGICIVNLVVQGARCWNEVLGLEIRVRNAVESAGKRLLPSAARLTKRRFSGCGNGRLANTPCVARVALSFVPIVQQGDLHHETEPKRCRTRQRVVYFYRPEFENGIPG
jgi:hypothetical protein